MSDLRGRIAEVAALYVGDTLAHRIASTICETVVQPEINRLADDLKWARSELAKADAENNAAGKRASDAETLLRELVDDGECDYDYHGQCKGHCFDYAPCPHARAKELLADLDRPKETS